jgi:dolichol-phosphate mannosyltransferase
MLSQPPFSQPPLSQPPSHQPAVIAPRSLLLPPTGALRLDDRPVSCYFSLIVPTYNESKNVGAMVVQLTQLLDQSCPENYEIILVDDDSPDRTWELAASLMPDYPRLQVMRRVTERGLATAVIRGWQVARGEVIGVIDGDLQHPPEVLAQLLGAIAQGADLAVASRHVEGGGISDWGLVRRSLSRGAQLLGLVIAPMVVGRVSDPMSGYFLLRRSALTGVELDPKGYKILLEVIGRGRLVTIAEVGYVFQERQEGESKVTYQQYIDYIHHLVKLRSRGRISRMARSFNFPATRFMRFGLVGLSGVVVDMVLLYLLHHPGSPLGLGLGLTRSKMIAAEFAIFNNFCWNDRWTFQDLAQRQNSRSQWCKRLLKFNLVCLMGLILNVLLLNFLFNVCHVNQYLANFMAIVAVTFWNFWINLKLSWRVTSTK